jgi:hypothetical protein
MQNYLTIGYSHLAMQHAATLEAVGGNILVVPFQNGITAEYGVTMVPRAIYRIFSVSMMQPALVRQELMLRVRAIKLMAPPGASIRTLHFLQKNNIRIEIA